MIEEVNLDSVNSQQQGVESHCFINSNNTEEEVMDKDKYLSATLKDCSNDDSKWQESSKTSGGCQVKDQLEMTVVAEVYPPKEGQHK